MDTKVLIGSLSRHQALCRPPGSIPESAKKITEVVQPQMEWTECLSPQEKSCFLIRLKYISADFQDKECPLSDAQTKVLEKIRALTEGIFSPQLNVLRVLSSTMMLQMEAFDFKNISVLDQKISPKEVIKQINCDTRRLFAWMESLLKIGGKCKGTDLEERFVQILRNWQVIDSRFVRNPTLFSKQNEALTLIQECLKHPDTLFPLLLAPLDHWDAAVQSESAAKGAWYTEKKAFILKGAVVFLEGSLEAFGIDVVPTIRKLSKLLKGKKGVDQWEKNGSELVKRISGLLGGVSQLLVSRELLQIEERARTGDIEAVRKLDLAAKKMSDAIDPIWTLYLNAEFANSVRGEKSKLTSAKSKGLYGEITLHLEEVFDFPIRQLRFLKEAFLGSLRHDVANTLLFQKAFETEFPTQCAFVKPIDLLIPTMSSLLEKEGEVEQTKQTMEFLAAIGRDLSVLAPLFAAHGFTSFVKRKILDIVQMIINLEMGLERLEVKRSLLLGLLKNIQEQFEGSLGLSVGSPHLYPVLCAPCGTSQVVDQTAMGLMEKGCHVAKRTSNDALCFIMETEVPQGLPLLEQYRNASAKFLVRLLELLQSPCNASLAQKVYTYFVTSSPEPATELLESFQGAQQLPKEAVRLMRSIDTILRTLQLVYLRPVLDWGRYVYLTGKKKKSPPRRKKTLPVEQKVVHLPFDKLNEGVSKQVAIHLGDLEKLLKKPVVSVRGRVAALLRTSALAIESQLLEMLKERNQWTHLLDVMAEQAEAKLEKEEVELLKRLSRMLSAAMRPDQHQVVELEMELDEAVKLTCQALVLLGKLSGKEVEVAPPQIPLSDEKREEVKEIDALQEMCAQLLEGYTFGLKLRSEPQEPFWQQMLRERHIGHILKDLPYHLEVVAAQVVPKPTEGMEREVALQMGLLLEKSMKLSSYYMNMRGKEGGHVLFDSLDEKRPRGYDHDLMRNLQLLPIEKIRLEKEELRAIEGLANFAQAVRYPKGELEGVEWKALLSAAEKLLIFSKKLRVA